MKTKQQKLEMFNKLDSKLKEVKVWPEYIIMDGQYHCYVRIFRHKLYWLLPVRVGAAENNGDMAFNFDQFNKQCYMVLINWIVDLNMHIKDGKRGRPIQTFLDINQESESNRITP